MSPSVKSLEFLIDKISELFNDHLLTSNVNKTVVIVFKRKSPSLLRNIRLYFNGEKLNAVNKCKYLGCILTSDLKDCYDMDRCNIFFNKSFGFLFRHFIQSISMYFIHCFNLTVVVFMVQSCGLIGRGVYVGNLNNVAFHTIML